MLTKRNFIGYFLMVLISFLACGAVAQDALKSKPKIWLAGSYEKYDADVKNYLVSEKLDGMRAYWDGKNLISRGGNKIMAPKWFVRKLPAQPLEGELWISRGAFEKVSGIARTKMPNDKDWRLIKFMVFDLPKSGKIFADRYEQMIKIATKANLDHLQIVEQFEIENEKGLLKKLEDIVRKGGEGLMLHKKTAKYQIGRSDNILKLKIFSDDEAVIIGYNAGKGKFKGMMGSLLVENNDGVTFKIGAGFTNEVRKNPPKIGSQITYKYYGKTKNNIPKFASFLRVREDF
jgi:DNA ligase 1